MLVLYHYVILLEVIMGVFGGDTVRYVTTEHPEITWYNRKYARYVNLTTRRYRRGDPLYYLGLHADIIWPIHHNVNIDIYFLEFLTNQYKRSFVEFHFDACDFFDGQFLWNFVSEVFAHPCPLEAGEYHFENITVPFKNIPANVPFTKGRIVTNVTSKHTKELLGFGHVDMEIKQMSVARMKNRQLRRK